MTQNDIIKMFDDIANKYDFVNRIISFGIDKKWRRVAVKESLKFITHTNNLIIADVACGTGDMIKAWQDGLAHQPNQIIGVDPSKNMLNIAKYKFANVKFALGSATNLPFEDNSVDIISIAFGIRNVIDIKNAVKEFERVLKHNGIVVILEFTKETNPSYLRKIVDYYTNTILPKIGSYLSNNKQAYTYLPQSIQNFQTTDELIALFDNFTLKKLKKYNLNQVNIIVLQR
ncbi:MAG: bifunctional demethylmenaquinone methyltransferase/2-methoxy-6-polyprenyl-1,4-benzoquinol methylase UbiE [Epsilonproteobacteria bacterium]|nr:bifunctional demethylmenaquinone methyltransferase/2-methoxy-6-polyprenyl-1,4-benzoquinol methylase UbiE [Campylobacterota bacterium]